jgi:hypothetical protein
MNDSRPDNRRRQVLAGVGTAGALAAGAALVGKGPQAPAEAPPGDAANAQGTPGYQVTQHVLRYYQTARI